MATSILQYMAALQENMLQAIEAASLVYDEEACGHERGTYRDANDSLTKKSSIVDEQL